MLRWPLPKLIIFDVQGSSGLDLNSAGNERIHNDKWNLFEETLAFLICKGLKKELNVEYWQQLFHILQEKDTSENLTQALT